MVLMRMSGDEDRAARHQQKRLDPYSDVSMTPIRQQLGYQRRRGEALRLR